MFQKNSNNFGARSAKTTLFNPKWSCSGFTPAEYKNKSPSLSLQQKGLRKALVMPTYSKNHLQYIPVANSSTVHSYDNY